VSFNGFYAPVPTGTSTGTITVTAGTIATQQRIPIYARLSGGVRFTYLIVAP